MADEVSKDGKQGATTPEQSETPQAAPGASHAEQELADAVGKLIASAKAFVREKALNLVEGGLAVIDEGKGKNKKGE